MSITVGSAGVVELVDALDSKSCSERSAGSTPATRTTFTVYEPGRPKPVGPALRLRSRKNLNIFEAKPRTSATLGQGTARVDLDGDVVDTRLDAPRTTPLVHGADDDRDQVFRVGRSQRDAI